MQYKLYIRQKLPHLLKTDPLNKGPIQCPASNIAQKNNEKSSSVPTYHRVEIGSNSSRGSCWTKLALLSFSSKILTPTANVAHLTSRHCMLIKSRGAYKSQKRGGKREKQGRKQGGRISERAREKKRAMGFIQSKCFPLWKMHPCNGGKVHYTLNCIKISNGFIFLLFQEVWKKDYGANQPI